MYLVRACVNWKAAGKNRINRRERPTAPCRCFNPPKTNDRKQGGAMDDLIKEFLVESTENLDRLDSELVKLETDPSSQELLSSIFRTIHTIKGSCGFLGFSKLEKVAHVGESLLSRLRDGKLSLTPEFTSGLLAMVDAIRTMLGEIQTTEQDGNESYPELIETLNKVQNQGREPPSKAAAGASLPK